MAIRSSVHEKAIIKDTGRIPLGKLAYSSCCGDMHPGLCRTNDATYFEQALIVARYLEGFFVASKVGQFYDLVGRNADGITTCLHLFFLCSVRKRTAKAKGHESRVTRQM